MLYTLFYHGTTTPTESERFAELWLALEEMRLLQKEGFTAWVCESNDGHCTGKEWHA